MLKLTLEKDGEKLAVTLDKGKSNMGTSKFNTLYLFDQMADKLRTSFIESLNEYDSWKDKKGKTHERSDADNELYDELIKKGGVVMLKEKRNADRAKKRREAAKKAKKAKK